MTEHSLPLPPEAFRQARTGLDYRLPDDFPDVAGGRQGDRTMGGSSGRVLRVSG
jgi:hypothetical protein